MCIFRAVNAAGTGEGSIPDRLYQAEAKTEPAPDVRKLELKDDHYELLS